MTTTLSTLPLRARQALTILALEAIEPLADEAVSSMYAARKAAVQAGHRAKEAEALAAAAPVPVFVHAAAAARRTADELDAADQKTYVQFSGVLRRRAALIAALEEITATRADNARWNDYMCERRSAEAAREAYLWA